MKANCGMWLGRWGLQRQQWNLSHLRLSFRRSDGIHQLKLGCQLAFVPDQALCRWFATFCVVQRTGYYNKLCSFANPSIAHSLPHTSLPVSTLNTTHHSRQSWGVGGSRPPRFWEGGRGRVVGGVAWGSLGSWKY